MQVQEIPLSRISHDWGNTKGWVERQSSESRAEHLLRLAREVASPEKFIPYARAMAAGAAFPPVYVVRRGRDMLLVDGCNRLAGAAWNGNGTILAHVKRAISDEEAGDLADAFWQDEIECPRRLSADGGRANG